MIKRFIESCRTRFHESSLKTMSEGIDRGIYVEERKGSLWLMCNETAVRKLVNMTSEEITELVNATRNTAKEHAGCISRTKKNGSPCLSIPL